MSIWFCETCERNGPIRARGDEGAYAVIQSVWDAHKAKSPDCTVGVRQLRILKVESV